MSLAGFWPGPHEPGPAIITDGLKPGYALDAGT